MTGVSGSNYVNSLSNIQRYDPIATKAKTAGFEYAPVNYGSKQSYINNSAMSYLSGIRENSKALASSIDLMTSATTFNKMNVVSSSKDHLAIGSASKPDDLFQDMSVQITQVASGQENKGNAVRGDSLYAGQTGTQQFEIEIEGKRTQVSVKVESGDTNKAVQQKMADAINSKNIGVTASVGSSGGNSALTVQSKGTGDSAKNRFSIRDMSGTLAATTGIDNVTKDAKDAVFSVGDGPVRTSSTNTVDLGNGIKATLLKETDDPVNVSVSKDPGYAVDKFKEMVTNFNKLLSSAKTSTNGNERLYNDLTNLSRSYAKSLEGIGVSVAKDGSLSVDSKKLEEAAQSKDGKTSELENLMTNYGSKVNSFGFAGRLGSIANNVEKNPAYYVNNAAESKGTTNTDWLNPLNEGADSYSSFNLRTYNQYLSLGYLFDMFV